MYIDENFENEIANWKKTSPIKRGIKSKGVKISFFIPSKSKLEYVKFFIPYEIGKEFLDEETKTVSIIYKDNMLAIKSDSSEENSEYLHTFFRAGNGSENSKKSYYLSIRMEKLQDFLQNIPDFKEKYSNPKTVKHSIKGQYLILQVD